MSAYSHNTCYIMKISYLIKKFAESSSSMMFKKIKQIGKLTSRMSCHVTLPGKI